MYTLSIIVKCFVDMESDILWKTTTYTCASIVVAGLVSWFYYTYCYAPYQVLKRAKIPGPSPRCLIGNIREILTKGMVKFTDEMISKYGPYSGFYIGCQPSILVSDLDMLKEIMIKSFDSFTDRSGLPGLRAVSSIVHKGLLTVKGDNWRRSRRFLTPTFSTLKLKVMVPIMQDCVDHMMERFTASCDSSIAVNVFSLYRDYTMNVLLSTTLGASQDSIGEHGKLMAAVNNTLVAQQAGRALNHSVMRILLSNFPWLLPLVRLFGRQSSYGVSWRYMETTARNIISEQRSQGTVGKHKYMLQLIMAAREDETKSYQILHNYNRDITKNFNDHEVVANITHFLVAGYETTSSCLAYTSYLLAVNPDKQDILCQEIENYYYENPSATAYEACQGIKYLDMVLFESLRIFPPISRATRMVTETRVINGVTIPKGVAIDIPLEHIHHDPNIWPEPEKFIPERFLPGEKEKRHPCAFMPFGAGPRNCIGLRFAMLEAKMLLLPVIQQMKFVVCADTEIPLKRKFGLTTVPDNGVYVLLESR